MLDANNGDSDSLVFVIVESFEDEADAHNARNEARERDANSIVGPSVFPTDVHARAIGKRSYKMTKIKTAREAWAAGLFTNDQIKGAANKLGRQVVLEALDLMSPMNFENMYLTDSSLVVA